jgi:hypothetical protein
MVAVSAVNPGFCHSRLTRDIESNPLLRLGVKIQKWLMARTTEVGSRTLIHPAVEPGERERHGHYLSSYKVTEECDYALSAEGKEVSKRLWVRTSVDSLTTVVHADVWLDRMKPSRFSGTSIQESIQLCLSTSFRTKRDWSFVTFMYHVVFLPWTYLSSEYMNQLILRINRTSAPYVTIWVLIYSLQVRVPADNSAK